MMMITRSRSNRFRYLPHVFFALAVALMLVFHDALRREVANLNARFTVEPISAEREASYQAVLYQAVSEENAKLSALLSLPRADIIGAGRVVLRPPRTLYDTLVVLVDPGAGIRKGDLALSHGFLVGAVSSMSVDSARSAVATVTLYSSPRALTEITVGTPQAIVVMNGVGGGAFTFEAPSAVAIVPGDLVTSASGNAVVAIVRSVQSEEGRTSAVVSASAPVSLSALDVVEFMHPR